MFTKLTNDEIMNVNGGSWDAAVCAGTGVAIMVGACTAVAIAPAALCASTAFGVLCGVGYLCGQTATLIGIANAL